MSNYPHSTLASSLSTSPYALQNNIEALINRRRTSGAGLPSHHRRYTSQASNTAPTPPPLSRESSEQDAQALQNLGDDDQSLILFPHDEHDEPPEPADDRGRPTEGQSWMGSWGRPRRRGYGAVDSTEASAPLVGGPSKPVHVSNASEGNSRSRSKGRTPPRTIVRPMTRAHRDAAVAAGASVGALGSVTSDAEASVVSSTTDMTSTSPHSVMRFGRGRSAERRPISPVVHMNSLQMTNEDEEEEEEAEEAYNAARSGYYLPGAAAIGEPLAGDPAQELDAADLGLPVGKDGQEVQTWQGALGVELPMLVRSTVPVFFTQLAEYSLSLASVISIGHLGTEELAASVLVNMTSSVTCFSILQGLATALDTLLPAAWTTNPTHVGLWSQRAAVVMVASMIPMFILWFNIEPILLALRQDPGVSELAGEYLAWLSLGIPGYGGNVILKKYLQAQNIMEVPTYILFIVAPLNIFLNWLLVWGPKMFRLGFRGGAIATAISFNLTCVMLLTYILFIGPKDAHHPWQAKQVFSKLGTVSSLGLAGTIMLSSEWWAWEICALAASFLGSTNLAAQSVLLSTCSTLYQFPAALGISTSVRVGNLLGAGRAWEAKWAARSSFVLSAIFGLVNSTICIVFRHKWGYLFSDNDKVVKVVAGVLPWIGIFQVMDGMSGAANAVLRALAMHSIGAIVSFTSYYLIGIPFGLWLTFGRLKMGLVGIWIGLAVALAYGSMVGCSLVWRADWVVGVKRVRMRLGLSPLPNDVKVTGDEGDGNGHGNDTHDVERAERQPLLA